MRLENPFNKIKKPLVLAGALTMASLLPNNSKGQEAVNPMDSIPKKEIKGRTGAGFEKELEVLRGQAINTISVEIASLESQINLLSDEQKYKNNIEAIVHMDELHAINQVLLCEQIKGEIDSIKFYNSNIDDFFQNYADMSILLNRTTDKNLKSFYKHFELLLKNSFLFSFRKYEPQKELESLSVKDYTGKSDEFKKDLISILGAYKNSLTKQFIDPFNTKQKLDTYLDNVWAGRVSIDMKKESLLEYKKMELALQEKRNLEFFRDTILSMYEAVYRHINSKEYLERLKKETGNEIQALTLQEYRLDILRFTEIEFEFNNHGLSRYEPNLNKIIYNMYDLVKNPSLDSGPHELSHCVDVAGYALTEKAKTLYQEAWVGDAEFRKLRREHPMLFEYKSEDEDARYHSGPTELNARKRVLEIYLEKSGIRKYGEEMTEEHYKKLVELFKSGKLDRNCSQILLDTKKEKLIEILNTIADISSENEDVLYLV